MELEDAIAELIEQRIDLCRHIERMAREVVTLGELITCIEQFVARTGIATVRARRASHQLCPPPAARHEPSRSFAYHLFVYCVGNDYRRSI